MNHSPVARHIFLSDVPFHDPPESAAAAILFERDKPRADQARGFAITTEQIAIGNHPAVRVYQTPRSNAAMRCGVLLACAAQHIIPTVVQMPAAAPAMSSTQTPTADPQVRAELGTLITRIDTSDGWLVWRYDQAPFAQRPGQVLLTLRRPKGGKVLLTFAQAMLRTIDQTLGYTAPSHQHIGRRIDSVWITIEGDLCLAMPPTQRRDEDVITVTGEITAISDL